jgi:hypothetical protein
MSKSNRQTPRREERNPPPPPSLTMAMNMLAGLNERLDQNFAHLSGLALRARG